MSEFGQEETYFKACYTYCQLEMCVFMARKGKRYIVNRLVSVMDVTKTKHNRLQERCKQLERKKTSTKRQCMSKDRLQRDAEHALRDAKWQHSSQEDQGKSDIVLPFSTSHTLLYLCDVTWKTYNLHWFPAANAQILKWRIWTLDRLSASAEAVASEI